MLYLHVCMSISKLYHALCPQWACACQSLGPLACVVTSIPPEACLNLTTCENTSGVLMSSMHTFLCSVRCWYACLACFAPPIWLSFLLCIFARLPHVHAWVYVSSIFQSSGTMDTRSKPTFVLLGHHLFFFDNIFVCLFMCFKCLFAPRLFHFPTLCDSIVHGVYVCVFVRESDHALCMMDSHGYVSDPLKPWVL